MKSYTITVNGTAYDVPLTIVLSSIRTFSPGATMSGFTAIPDSDCVTYPLPENGDGVFVAALYEPTVITLDDVDGTV